MYLDEMQQECQMHLEHFFFVNILSVLLFLLGVVGVAGVDGVLAILIGG